MIFVSAVTAHRQSARWPNVSKHRSTDKMRESLRHRKTDLFVRSLDLGATPLSVLVGLDWASSPCVAPWLQSAWGAEVGSSRNRATGAVGLWKTYPAAALRAWGSARAPWRPATRAAVFGELRDGQRSERARIMSEIEEQTNSWFTRFPMRCAMRAVASDHTLDALVCALVAPGYSSQGSPTRRPRNRARAALREGWIHVPSDALSSLGRIFTRGLGPIVRNVLREHACGGPRHVNSRRCDRRRSR
jgi:hypothetical protein